MPRIKKNRPADWSGCEKFQNEIDESLPPADPEPDEINPFLLNPVLKVLMSQMTIEDLKRSRGVCQLWDQHTTQELQKLTSQMKPQEFIKADKIQEFVKQQDSPNKVFLSNKMKINLQALSTEQEENERFFQNFQPKSLALENTLSTEGDDANVYLALELLKILQNCSENIENLQVSNFLQHKCVFNDVIEWPENLKFPQLEEITVDDLSSHFDGMEKIHFIIKNVIKNSPKFKGLILSEQPSDHLLCDQFKSCGLIEKLKNLTICYTHVYLQGLIPVFAQDLLQMALNGLKLTKFEISFTFQSHLSKEFILEYLENLKVFLKTQSGTLVNLKIYIGYECCEYRGKFTMPSLPKLKVLEIGNNHEDSSLTFNQMDLPTILPNLYEIIIYFNFHFCDLSEIFSGSLEGVEKVRFKFKHLNGNSFSCYGRLYSYLETLFPNVVEFEMDHIYMESYYYNYEEFNQQCELYEGIPWENTLKKLILHPPTLENLKFESLSHLQALWRLELTKEASTWFKERYTHFDFEGLSKTNVKSVKIQNYLINKLKKIRSRFTLDYIPANFTQKTH